MTFRDFWPVLIIIPTTNYVKLEVEWQHPKWLSARADAEDNPSWEKAMNRPNKVGYWKVMEKEDDSLEKEMDSWEITEREDWMNVLPGTWAFHCKRFPDGTVQKLKARFCIRGDKQHETIDYFNTYTPVVNWQTVQLMLVYCCICPYSY
jgi:hypothetical protein